MQNTQPTLYILEIDSFLVTSAKIFTIFFHFTQNIKIIDRVAVVRTSHVASKGACVQC